MKNLFISASKLLIIISILSNCKGDSFSTGPFFERAVSYDIIFRRNCVNCDYNYYRNTINVSPYFYSDSNKIYYINGDLSLQNLIKYQDFKYVDSVSSKPSLQWSGGGELVATGIFKNRIETTEKGIKNIQDIVWLWHSGLGTGRNGSVKFTDGRNVLNGKVDEISFPTPLTKGNFYSWGVWSWGISGEKIYASSREQIFIVK